MKGFQLNYIRNANEVLNNVLAGKFSTIDDSYYIVSAIPEDLKKKIEDIAADYYKRLYVHKISNNFVRV